MSKKFAGFSHFLFFKSCLEYCETDLRLQYQKDILIPCINFTNTLSAAFTCTDPKSAKKTVSLTVFFAILGSAHVKAARKMLVKWTPLSLLKEV